jgi:hypothetical protein
MSYWFLFFIYCLLHRFVLQLNFFQSFFIWNKTSKQVSKKIKILIFTPRTKKNKTQINKNKKKKKFMIKRVKQKKFSIK